MSIENGEHNDGTHKRQLNDEPITATVGTGRNDFSNRMDPTDDKILLHP
jgi:hypothetical protein